MDKCTFDIELTNFDEATAIARQLQVEIDKAVEAAQKLSDLLLHLEVKINENPSARITGESKPTTVGDFAKSLKPIQIS